VSVQFQLGKNIKRLRKSMGWRQEDLAEKLHVSRESVAKWETGRQSPDVDMLVKLSELFNMSIDQLVFSKFYQKELLHEAKQTYQLNIHDKDSYLLDCLQYLLSHPSFLDGIYQTSKLSKDKQERVNRLFLYIVKDYTEH
jgi:transcriptional regulator with XRE-family HTH domain